MRNGILIFLMMVVKKSTGNIYIYYDVVRASVPSEKPYEVENLGWGWKGMGGFCELV